MEAIEITTDSKENNPQILHSVFLNVMQYAESENGDEMDVIAFTASNYGYTIGFYANQEDGHKLIVDEFGHMVKGEWVECEPTKEQINYMENLIKKEIKRIKGVKEQEEVEHAYALQCEADEMKYGHPGAIYSKYY
jgi:hypothetical protein